MMPANTFLTQYEVGNEVSIVFNPVLYSFRIQISMLSMVRSWTVKGDSW